MSVKRSWDARYKNPAVPHDSLFYTKCMVGGILSCGLTHMGMCPVDVVKCNIQVNPQKYKSFISATRTVIAEEGMGTSGICKGWLPTFFGYSAQGCFKYGLYEVFKDYYMNLAGEHTSSYYTGPIWLAASASAEFFADIALCPMEMVKVKVQISPPGTFPTNFRDALTQMYTNRQQTKFPFGSIKALWGRQIPYTMAKFYFFERIVQLFYTNVFTKPKESYNKITQLGITFASGYIAGIICALITHPADTLVSLKGKPENAERSYSVIAKEFGYKNLFVKGLGPRIIMIGTLTGFQWWIYDSFKTYMGMGTTGGKMECHCSLCEHR